jgi:hypothetical protein
MKGENYSNTKQLSNYRNQSIFKYTVSNTRIVVELKPKKKEERAAWTAFERDNTNNKV